MIKRSCFMFITLLLSLTATAVQAQGIIDHQQPTTVERGEDVTLRFEVSNMSITSYSEAYLHYKFSGDAGFTQIPAELNGNTFIAALEIPSNAGTNVEYYFEATLTNNEKLSYPMNDPSGQPVNVNVVEAEEEKSLSGTENEIDYTVLSPLPDEKLVPSDALIAITLFYSEDSNIKPSDFKLMFDGADVTADADVTPYLITYKPENLKPGDHNATLSYMLDGEEKVLTEWSFPVVDPSELTTAGAFAAGGDANNLNAQVELSARNQTIGGNTQEIYNGRARISGSQGWLRYSLNGYMTSQEDDRLQPMNRYGVELYAGDIFELQAGHIYPTISPFMISGNRVLGLNSGLHLFDRILNFQFVYGQMKRSVSNIYEGIEVDETIINGGTANADTTYNYNLNFARGGIGTHQRDIMAGRFAIGNGDVFQLGFNAMKVSDDMNSINTIRDYEDLTNNQDLLNSLSSADRDRLKQDSSLTTPSSNPKPKENFAFGGDMAINIDDGNIRLRTDFGASLVNDDISTGVLNNERAQDLGFGDLGDAGDIIDQLSFLIIINENMSYLPFEFSQDGVGIEENDFLFFSDVPVPTSLLASQSSLSLNYFGNNLTAKYRWVGPDYQTLASSALRQDIAGFNIQDRFRLFSNTVYVTLGYSDERDNVVGREDATINTVAYNGDVSWFPVSRDLPRITVGFRSQGRDNGVARFNPNLSGNLVNSAVRNLDSDGSIVSTPKDIATNQYKFNVRQAVDLAGFNNDINFSMFVIDTKDNAFEYGDFSSTSMSLGLSTDFEALPLRTNVGYTINSSESLSGLSQVDVSGLSLGAEYFLFDNTLNLNATVALTDNEITSQNLTINDNDTPNEYLDDYYQPNTDASGEPVISKTNQSSFVVRGGATWNMMKNHTLRFDASLTNISSSVEGVNIPSDQYMQLRYIYRF